MKRYLHFAILAVLILSRNTTQAHLVNFDDGVAGNSVGSFYGTLGINFSNAVWNTNMIGTIYDTNGQATAPLSIRDAGTQGFNSSLDPLVITFDTPQEYVGILGVNVGFAGVRMDAYDSIVGGNLLGSSEGFGTTLKGEIPPSTPGGMFSHEEVLLGVTAPNIMRVELYRPNPGANDGVHYDNLEFTPGSATPDLAVHLPATVLISRPISKSPYFQIDTTTSPPGGSFKWEIIQGEDKIKFLSASEGKLADHIVIQGTAPSEVSSDVEIKVTYTVNSQSAQDSGYVLVQKPSALTIFEKTPPEPYYDGYTTDYAFQVMDQCGNPVTYKMYVKEKRKKAGSNYKVRNILRPLKSGNDYTSWNGIIRDVLSLPWSVPDDFVFKVEQQVWVEGWDVGTRCQIYYSDDAVSIEGPCGPYPQ